MKPTTIPILERMIAEFDREIADLAAKREQLVALADTSRPIGS